MYVGLGSSSPYSGDGALPDYLWGTDQRCVTLVMVVGVGGSVQPNKLYWPPKNAVAKSNYYYYYN